MKVGVAEESVWFIVDEYYIITNVTWQQWETLCKCFGNLFFCGHRETLFTSVIRRRLINKAVTPSSAKRKCNFIWPQKPDDLSERKRLHIVCLCHRTTCRGIPVRFRWLPLIKHLPLLVVDWSSTFKNLLYYYSPLLPHYQRSLTRCWLFQMWPSLTCLWAASWDRPPLHPALLSLCPDVYRIWDEPPKVSFLTTIRGLAPSFFYLLGSSVSLCSMRRHHKPHASCAAVSFPPEKSSTSCRTCPPARPPLLLSPSTHAFSCIAFLSCPFFSFFFSSSLRSPLAVSLVFAQHTNPGHAGPFPVASLHNANPTSPTSASMAGAHALRSPASPVVGPIELIPSVTNPENLPCLPEIPPIQVGRVQRD